MTSNRLLAFSAAALVGCSVFDRVNQYCGRRAQTGTVQIMAGHEAWVEGTQPVAVLSPERLALAFVSGAAGPGDSVDARLSIVNLNAANPVAGRTCPSTDDTDSAGGASNDAPGVAATPALAAGSDPASSTAVAVYRWAAAANDSGPGVDEIRIAYLDSSGCPSEDASGQLWTSIGPPDPARMLLTPAAAKAGSGVYAVVWLNRARDPRSFDDRLVARLVQPFFPYFGANAWSPTGAAGELPVDDRWIVSPTLISVAVPQSPAAFAVLWYAKYAQSGATRLLLLDEKFATVNDPISIGVDTDTGDALADKTLVAVYSQANRAVFAAWTEIESGESVVVGRRIDLQPEPHPGPYFEISPPAAGSAYSPSLVALDDGEVFASWVSKSGVVGRLFRPNGEARFTDFACGPEPFTLFDQSGATMYGPVSALSGGQLVTLLTRQKRAEPEWSIAAADFPLKKAFPQNE